MILGQGFDINVRTSRGTALHEAAICGKVDVVRVLLAGDINLELRDGDEKTVLEVMDEIKTPVSVEIIHIIMGNNEIILYNGKRIHLIDLDNMGALRKKTKRGGGRHQKTPSVPPKSISSSYDNVSLTPSLESESLNLGSMSTSTATIGSTATGEVSRR